MIPVLRDASFSFFDWLGWWWDAIETWDDAGGETVCAMFIAALSHHGAPINIDETRAARANDWKPLGDLNPQAQIERVGLLARDWFPAAFALDAAPLPSAPAFQHMFLGLCTLADWIGSNESWFPYRSELDDDYMNKRARPQAKRAIVDAGLNVSNQRANLSQTPPTFSDLFGFPNPNPIQRAAYNAPIDSRLIIIESETGSGKTEAALWRFARLYREGLVDGIYFALPTRAAASQIHGRVQRFANNLFPENNRPDVLLAVPGYVEDGAPAGALHDYDVWWERHTERPWASESSKQYLAAQIAVGTVDQAMMGALKIKHAHMRAACLARNLLVVDEVHASDTYMRRILKAVLDAHLAAGGCALLMSATLGSAARREWLSAAGAVRQYVQTLDDAIQSPYPALSAATSEGERVSDVAESDRRKTVSVSVEPIMRDADRVARIALSAAGAGAKVLVIRNTVEYAIRTQRALEDATLAGDALLFARNGVLTLHHGRFAVPDRRMLDMAVESALGADRPAAGVVVVGTQTLEQSLDIDADLLITDLCPVDVLLQRIGRLHRHPRSDRPAAHSEPKCIVLTPPKDLSALLKDGKDANGLGPKGYVYDDLRIVEATRRLLAAHPVWRVPDMNRELVEHATHPDALDVIVQELGEDWRLHANDITGGRIGDSLTASESIIRRDKSFYEDNDKIQFPSSDENIRTRLGDEGIEMRLDPPRPSPFNDAAEIDKLTLPIWWLDKEIPHDDAPARTALAGEGFSFEVGARAFEYDRWGLRQL